MELLRDIINDAMREDVRLVTILRKSLVLADQLNNESLRDWASKELNGYPDHDDLPSYRVGSITAKGLFIGGFGAQINSQPLPSSVLEQEHRWWATTAYLNEPIASYDRLAADPDKDGCATVQWPADMTAYYQSKFFEGNYALNRAWQEIPMGMLVAAVDTVRTRILQFALEIQREIGPGATEDATPPPATVEQAVQTIIYGGTNIFNSTVAGDVQLVGQQLVVTGDFDLLSKALNDAGVSQEHVAALATAIDDDRTEGANTGFGRRVGEWLQKSGAYVGKEGAKAASTAAGKAISTAVLAYFGIAS